MGPVQPKDGQHCVPFRRLDARELVRGEETRNLVLERDV
jgi:hypothetical protein